MDFITIMLVALGLAMDCFAVSVSSGLTMKIFNINNALKIAFSFGLFQAVMPVIGWAVGASLEFLVSNVDHWIAFGLLCFIGAKMLYESGKKDPDPNQKNPFKVYSLLLLSVATSIDALAVGLSLAFLEVSVATPVIAIGIVAFSLSFVGVAAGNKFESRLGNKAEIAGGIILIAIGLRILSEHLL